LAGDANLDASVDTSDFNILAANFNALGANWLTADFNGDTIVDTLDFNALAANFGQNTTPQLGASLVPEPQAFALIGLALVCFRRSGR
jgi:hypothetical protein